MDDFELLILAMGLFSILIIGFIVSFGLAIFWKLDLLIEQKVSGNARKHIPV